MKNTNLKLYFLSFVFMLFVAACSDNDDDTAPNSAPTTPELVSPASSATNVDTTVTFTWKASTDNEGTKVSYAVHYASSEDMANATKVDDDEPTDLTATTKLKAGTTYHWQVTATDEAGKSAKSAVREFTTVAAAKPDVVQPTDTVAYTTGSKVYFSEYYEGSGNDKYIEIFNGTTADIDLANYVVMKSNNGAGFADSLILSGTLKPDSIYLIANASASQTILDQADKTVAYSNSDKSSQTLSFNGNDAIGLFVKNSDNKWSLCDVVGIESSNADFAKDKALIRKEATTTGSPYWSTAQSTYEEKPTSWVYSVGVREIGAAPVQVGPTTDSKLLISEYCDAGNDKYIEFYNSGTTDIDLTPYIFKVAVNSDTDWTEVHDLTGTLAPGKTYIIMNNNSGTTQSLKDAVNDASQAGVVIDVKFTGNDAVALFKTVNNQLSMCDVIGTPGGNAYFEVNGVANASNDHTLVRDEAKTVGQPDWSKATTEYVVKEKNWYYSLGIRGVGVKPAYQFTDAPVVDVMDEDFQTLEAGRPTIAGWYTELVTGTEYFVKNGSAYLGIDPAEEATESWLVSPKLNFDATGSHKNISFDLKRGYMKNEQIQIFVSTNFDPTQGVAAATWTEVTSKATLPEFADNGWSDYVSTGSMDLSDQSGTVRVAIKYSCDGTQNGGRLYMDNFKFNYEVIVPTEPTDSVLVYKTDFETWTDDTHPDGWDKVENVTKSTEQKLSGSYSAKHTGGTKDLAKNITLEPNKKYRVTYYVYDNEGGKTRPWSYVKNAANASLTTDNEAGLRPSGFSADSDKWQKVVIDFTTPADTDHLYWEWRTYKGGSVYFDDFSVYEMKY